MPRPTTWLLSLSLLAGCAFGTPAPTPSGGKKTPVRATATRSPSLAPSAEATDDETAPPSPTPRPSPLVLASPVRLSLPSRITIDVPLSLGGAAILSNNSAGLVSNNGGGVISDHGGGYRVLDLSAPAPVAMAPVLKNYLSVVGAATSEVQILLNRLAGRTFTNGEVFSLPTAADNPARIGRVDRLGEVTQLLVWAPELANKEEPGDVLRFTSLQKGTLSVHVAREVQGIPLEVTGAMAYDLDAGTLGGDIVVAIPGVQASYLHLELLSRPAGDPSPARFTLRAAGLGRQPMQTTLQRTASVAQFDQPGAGALIYAQTQGDLPMYWMQVDRQHFLEAATPAHTLYLDATGLDLAPDAAPEPLRGLAPADAQLITPPTDPAVLDHPRDDPRFIYPAEARVAMPTVPASPAP